MRSHSVVFRSPGQGLGLLTRLILATLAAGCPEPRLGRTLPPGVRVDTYLQQAADRIDVLWIIDDSGSMAPRQENLGRSFDAFIAEFTRNAVDYRLAVTTTDVFKEAGRFVGAPAILGPRTPGLIDAFAANVRVGVSGSPYEAGMDAARLALDRQRIANEASLAACKAACIDAACRLGCEAAELPFLRTDAYLYLVFVSDEDDTSSRGVDAFARLFETVKGPGNEGMVSTAAIVGDVPANACGATPGTRYEALARLTGGAVGSVCAANFAPTLKALATNAVGLKRRFALQAAPEPDTLEVRVVYPCTATEELLAPCEAVDRSACASQPAEAMALVCTPPRDGVDGWSYVPEDDVVVFAGASIPGLAGRVELTYAEEGRRP